MEKKVKNKRLRSPVRWLGGKGGMTAKLLPLILALPARAEEGAGMKALSFWQPWASLIVRDENPKDVENRTWPIRYPPVRFIVHAGKKVDPDARDGHPGRRRGLAEAGTD